MNTYTKMGRGVQFVAAAFRRATALTKIYAVCAA